jgi:hypothetical protein
MQKNIELAKKIYKEPETNWLSHLEDLNLLIIFKPIYTFNYRIEVINKIVSFIILAYDNNSEWIDIKKDRYQNKISIIEGIGADPRSELFNKIISDQDDEVKEVILKYLIHQTDHRWQEIMSLLDYHSKTILFCNRKTDDKFLVGTSINKETKEEIKEYEYLDPREVSKINNEKGDLLEKAVRARKTADELLKSIETDYQKIDYITQSEFGFQFTEIKKYDITSWEQRLRKRKQGQL